MKLYYQCIVAGMVGIGVGITLALLGLIPPSLATWPSAAVFGVGWLLIRAVRA